MCQHMLIASGSQVGPKSGLSVKFSSGSVRTRAGSWRLGGLVFI